LKAFAARIARGGVSLGINKWATCGKTLQHAAKRGNMRQHMRKKKKSNKPN
jgi:hypothetical protein